jgi:3-isopropylmalate dehydrogenase
MLNIAVLQGDGIGPEVLSAAVDVLAVVAADYGIAISCQIHPFGGAATDRYGSPFPDQTKAAVAQADAIILGAVGGPRWSSLPRVLRPESALLDLRHRTGAYANLRPAAAIEGLERQSALRADIVRRVDVLVVRELAGGIYYGEPRGRNASEGWNTMRYSRREVERVARVAFDAARRRRRHVLHADKENVLECSALFREIVDQVAQEYRDVRLEHAYVDAAALRLVAAPRTLDVVLTENLFGDILSDVAAAIPGSLGVLPSASLGDGPAIFEPVHGSAPEIAGRGIANPAGAMLSAAMLLEYSAHRPDAARALQAAVWSALATSPTRDLGGLASTADFVCTVKERLYGNRTTRARYA